MRLGARNVQPRVVVGITHGAAVSLVRIGRGGTVGRAAITRAAVETLGLAVSERAGAVVRANDVMVGCD